MSLADILREHEKTKQLEKELEEEEVQEEIEIPESYGFKTEILYFRDPECTQKLNYIGEGSEPLPLSAKKAEDTVYVLNNGQYPYAIEKIWHDNPKASVSIENLTLDVGVPVKLTVVWNTEERNKKDPLKTLKGTLHMKGYYFSRK